MRRALSRKDVPEERHKVTDSQSERHGDGKNGIGSRQRDWLLLHEARREAVRSIE